MLDWETDPARVEIEWLYRIRYKPEDHPWPNEGCPFIVEMWKHHRFEAGPRWHFAGCYRTLQQAVSRRTGSVCEQVYRYRWMQSGSGLPYETWFCGIGARDVAQSRSLYAPGTATTAAAEAA